MTITSDFNLVIFGKWVVENVISLSDYNKQLSLY